jgi:hypothetical protein
VVRAAILTLVAVVPTVGQQLTLFAADATPADPLGLLTSIGVGGLLAAVVYLWQRDTAKQRDKATDQLTMSIPVIQGLQHAVEQGTEATKASTAAMTEMTELMKYRWPREP